MTLSARRNSGLGAGLLVATIAILALVVSLAYATGPNPTGAAPGQPSQLSTESLPVPLCQFGVNVTADLNRFDTASLYSLRMGWYLDYLASVAPVEPNGAEYAPVITLSQVGANGYSSSPSGAQLQAAIAANPGAVWFIGNEPDRRVWQDDLEPHVYALAYHDLYQLIKAADPTSRIFAGTIVQPTPIRLQYLDMVLDSYRANYGVPMPVDGWSIHNFLLNEVNEERCDEVPPEKLTNWGCSGAGVPPGIDVLYGELLPLERNDDIFLFRERILRFRQWMADRGYRGLPLYLSEYGVLLPDIFAPPADFPPSRVNAFMSQTFDYLMTASDPLLGDPNDNHRLVQKWSWFSTNHSAFNGWLFDPVTYQISPMGINFADYVANLPSEVDLYPSRIFADPPVPFSQGGTVTFTLKAVIANSGNQVEPTEPVAVRFYEGNPTSGGVQIGAAQDVSLAGCGDHVLVEVTWANVLPGAHQVYVSVLPAQGESDSLNNIAKQVVVVATEKAFLPLATTPSR